MIFHKTIYRDPEPAITSNGDGGGTATATAWVDTLPENVRSTIPPEFAKDPNVIKYKDIGEFVKGHVNQAKLVGAKGVIVPGENATPEERERFYNSLGRPEKPEGYKFSKIENLHKDIAVTPEFDAGLATVFHKHGLNNSQSDSLRKEFVGLLNEARISEERRETEAMQGAETQLRKEWGADYEKNINMVAKGIAKFGGQEAIDAMGGEKGIGNNPIVLKALGKVFGMLSEDQISSVTNQGPDQITETKESAQKKINEMMSDPKHPIHHQNDPKHEEAVQQRYKLYQIIHPSEAAQ